MTTTPGTSEVRARLEDERQRIAAEITVLIKADRGSEADRAGRSGGTSDVAEQASETFEHDNSLALLRSLRVTQDQIERAVAKFEQGTYGRCDECGGPIAAERLEAIPYATLCIDCKGKSERRRSASPGGDRGPSSTAAV